MALEEDIDEVVEMARMNIEETRPENGFDEVVCRETYYGYLDRASPTIFVAEKDRALVGFLLAEMNSYRASAGLFTTQEVLFVKPAHRGTRAAAMLMKHLIAWSRGLGAKEIIGGNDNSFNSDRTARFLEHFGFERVGNAMRRGL
ncbi:GNAT family N-acetyltransferase [Shinella sp. WSC3-e]|nr:GNAT family N-acetyltransferase [Rhizobiaceae bacterium]CAK7259096.1 GNAT family N-acetyltransferase [Shinella sp. WSC3-e]